jgi:phosphoglycolate phosphatase-like HAD superfamily hydrolase
VDSDGCVFDTVALKQRLCFHPLIIARWNLAPIGPLVRETADYVNLSSQWRGQNRFLNLLRTFDLLAERPEAKAGGALPDTAALRRFVESGMPLGHPALEEAARATRDPELVRLLEWSLAVDAAVAQRLGAFSPFSHVLASLALMRAQADIVCVSQTPAVTVEREWKACGLLEYANGVAGPELGTKSDHLALCAARYAPGRALMIGDAPGDMEAADRAGVLFYPIHPGHEEAAWQLFESQAWARFLGGTFEGPFADDLRARFIASLYRAPPWK